MMFSTGVVIPIAFITQPHAQVFAANDIGYTEESPLPNFAEKLIPNMFDMLFNRMHWQLPMHRSAMKKTVLGKPKMNGNRIQKQRISHATRGLPGPSSLAPATSLFFSSPESKGKPQEDTVSWSPAAKVSSSLQNSVEFPLYNFADLQSVRTWNYEKPTLVMAGRYTHRSPWQEAGTYWKKFGETYPIFQSVDLEGLAIFGGSIVDMLLNKPPKDIDLAFFDDRGTAKDQGQALAERVNKFVTDIYTVINKHNAELNRKKDQGIPIDGSTSSYKYTPINIEDLLVTRYKNVYEIKVPCPLLCSVPIQISHCTNLNKLLTQIDISCSAIAYYKGEIVMPERAKNSLESLAIEINPCDKSSRYLERVKRYFDKGFDVILPDLDVSKLHKRNLEFHMAEVLDMPYFRASYNGIRGNKIETLNCELTNITSSDTCSGLEGYVGRHDGTVPELIHKNIRHLVHGDLDQFTYIGQGETYRQAFLPDVLITERMLTNSYETVSKKLFNSQALNICKIEQYFTCRKINDILRELIIDFAGQRGGKDVYVSKAFDDHVKKYLEQLLAEQIEEAKRMILKLRGTGSLAINMTRVNVVPCSKQEWYGTYLKSDQMGRSNSTVPAEQSQKATV